MQICCIYVDVVLEVGLRIWLGLKNDYANLSFVRRGSVSLRVFSILEGLFVEGFCWILSKFPKLSCSTNSFDEEETNT